MGKREYIVEQTHASQLRMPSYAYVVKKYGHIEEILV